MLTLHIDTETDGLNVNGVPSDDPRQPNMISLTAVLDDADGNTLKTMNTLIKPARPILPELTAIHGITTERAEAEGITLFEAMNRFADIARQCDIMSAFNFFFDFKMVKIGCARMVNGGDDQLRRMFETKQSICTMDAARKHLKAGRFISLQDAHTRLFGAPFEGAHQSLADCHAHRRVFYHLRDVGALPAPKPMTRKEYATPAPAATEPEAA